MLFNSFEFLLFFPVVAFVYFVLPFRFRWPWLLLSSYYFYMCWKPEYVVLIILSTLIDYYIGLSMAEAKNRTHAKHLLTLSIICNLGVLFAFKYYNFFNDSFRELFSHFNIFYNVPSFKVLLPVGISFYTFQSLSYTIDVYSGKRPAEKHLGLFALYIAFFPQLVAGPIERSTHLLPQLYKKNHVDYQRVTDGLKLILWGLFKKIVIADRLAYFVNYVYNNPAGGHGYYILIATYFFAFQIYCDFSGYSDIAIGSAQVMGYELMENFKRPYLAQSIPEFWKRWHISLSTWFKEYLYFPLGGNRVPVLLWARNILVVFLLSGIWHGANWTFFVWGFLHGIYMLSSRFKKYIQDYFLNKYSLKPELRLGKGIRILVTFNLVCFAWIFFRANSISDAGLLIKNLFEIPLYHVNNRTIITNLFLIALLITVQIIQERTGLRKLISKWPVWFRWPAYYVLLLLSIFWGIFDTTQFIYFQF